MDRQWMYADRRSKEFIDGVHYFLGGANDNKCNGFISCPCDKCKNQKEYSTTRTIHAHLFQWGFMRSYNCWTSHREVGVAMEDDEVEDENIPDWVQYGRFEENTMGEAELDVEGNAGADELGQILRDLQEDCESEKEVQKLERMLADHRTALYPGCEKGYKKLSTILEFLQWKAKNGVSDKAFGELLKLVKNILPEGNELPESTYEAKKIVCPLGLEVQKIHACPNDYILYHGEYENLEACPVCKALRYKIRRDDLGEVDGQPLKKRIPAKVMWYFPIIPRLKRFFRNKSHARMMRWHTEERKQDGMLRHPADGSQWRNIDRTFKDFGEDARNVRKVVYMGHRRFLAANHPVRKKGKHFEQNADHRTKPKHRNGKAVFEMVKDLKVVFGKGPGSQPIESEDGHAAMWKKNSIFWELPYWEVLDIRHAIDVMHLTKNLCVNLLGFLGVYGKSKDTLKARNDLKHMEQRKGLHPEPNDKGSHYLNTGLSMEQLLEDASIETAPVMYTFKLGEPLVTPDKIRELPTQMYRFHQWYMDKSAMGREMFGARVRNSDYYQGEDVIWIRYKEVFDLYHLKALDVSILSAWTLMEIQLCRQHNKFNTGFMDPHKVNTLMIQQYKKQTEDNIVHFLVQQHYKRFILLPYNTP
ncbi:uncharacterized protein LOC127776981 [Oryza glaberrima]|uniref:uncharacterized protein LOC127776981 n=1 Tax=Oryza glaberrima TaxID=4538 RepID=UPI00224C1329|nr:uncharacterized protein LOC127776981 [Oryza glaberrima]